MEVILREAVEKLGHPGDVVKVHNTFFSDVVNFMAPFSGVAASAATAAVIN